MTRLNFTEFEAFAEAVQEASMTMRMRSLEEPKWSLQYATVGSLRVQQGYEGGGSIAEGATVSDGWTFYHQSRPVHANGQVATEDEVFAAPPGGEFCLACQPRHDWLTVFVPTSLLFPSPQELEFASSARATAAQTATARYSTILVAGPPLPFRCRITDLSSWILPLHWTAFEMNYWRRLRIFSRGVSIPQVVTSFVGIAKRSQR